MLKHKIPNPRPQADKFADLARELECDESEEAFDERLKQLARDYPPSLQIAQQRMGKTANLESFSPTARRLPACRFSEFAKGIIALTKPERSDNMSAGAEAERLYLKG